MNMFSEDHPFGRLVSRLMDLIVINLLWVLCCVPVVTIGASTAAMFDRAAATLRGENDGLLKPFFKSFAHYFLRATALFLLAAALGAFIAFDFIAALQIGSVLGILCQIVILISVILYLGVVSHVFPALVYFDGKLRDTIGQACRLALRNGWRTLAVMALSALPVLLFVFWPVYFVKTIVFWAMLGMALIAYACCALTAKRLETAQK